MAVVSVPLKYFEVEDSDIKADKKAFRIQKETLQSVFDKLMSLRESYVKDLQNMKDPDEDSKLIIKAKIVAIGQALNELGFSE